MVIFGDRHQPRWQKNPERGWSQIVMYKGQPSAKERARPSGPLAVGLFFGLLAIVLSLLGLARERNLSLLNITLAIVLGGGVWGVISWAIATAVVHVEQDLVAGENHQAPNSHDSPPGRGEGKE